MTCLLFQARRLIEKHIKMRIGLAIGFVLVAALSVVESCCIPPKVALDWTMNYEFTRNKAGQVASVSGNMNGNSYLDTTVLSLRADASGTYRMSAVHGGTTIVVDANVRATLALVEGSSGWMTLSIEIPNQSSKNYCRFVEINGDFPAYRCFLNNIADIVDHGDGRHSYERQRANYSSNVEMTVDDNCVPTREVVQLSGYNITGRVQADMTNPRQEFDMPDLTRPSPCDQKKKIRIPSGSEGGPAALIRQYFHHFRNRFQKRSVPSQHARMQRLIRDTFTEAIQELTLSL